MRERRDRLAAKPDELFDKLCHNPEVFDERRVVPVARTVPNERIARLLHGSGEDVAFYLGAWDGLEVGTYTVAVAVEMVERCGGGLAALRDASRVYYKSEDGKRFFLVADADYRKRLTAALDGKK